MTLIQGFNLRGLVEVSSDVALIVAYYKFLAVFADNELSQVWGLSSILVLDKISDDLLSLSVSNIDHSDIWLSGYAKLVEQSVELDADGRHV